MSTTVLAILLIIYIFATIIAGIIYGNKKLIKAEGQFVKGWVYYFLFVLKQAVISFILFAIFVLIFELISKESFWGYLWVIVLGVLNFYYASNKVKKEYEKLNNY
jgi:hypothetical protein